VACNRAAAEDNHLAGCRPFNAAEQNAAPAVRALKEMSRYLRCHAPGDFRHRREQG